MEKEVQIKKLMIDSSNLPTMPAVAKQLLSIWEWENIDLQKIAEIISMDISLASKILRIVNSPFYGFPYKISTVSQALVVLGARATRSLTLSFSLLKMTPDEKRTHFDYAGFWTRSLNTAIAAREFALIAGVRSAEEAFLAGLLQDIGVMVIGHCAPEEYALIAQESADRLAPPVEVERKYLGTDHVELAKHLFEEWKLPVSLLIPVLYHHEPETAKYNDAQTLLPIHIQYFAGRIGKWLYSSRNNDDSFEKLGDYSSLYFGVPPLELEALMRRIDERVNEMSELFDLKTSRPTTYAVLLEEANQALGKIVDEQECLLRELEAAKQEARKLTEQLRTANLKLLDESRKDSLTDLANRRHFDEFLERELERSFRYGHPIALLFIDIDNFKSVNDQCGHLGGDAALKQFAEILKTGIRLSDVAIRYGGEEFIIVLVESSVSGAIAVAERIRRSIERTPFFGGDKKRSFYITASIGIATWTPQGEAIEMHTLIEKADFAMYRAKKAGKNCISIFEIKSEIK